MKEGLLTDRQKEVLRYRKNGLTQQQVADSFANQSNALWTAYPVGPAVTGGGQNMWNMVMGLPPRPWANQPCGSQIGPMSNNWTLSYQWNGSGWFTYCAGGYFTPSGIPYMIGMSCAPVAPTDSVFCCGGCLTGGSQMCWDAINTTKYDGFTTWQIVERYYA